MYIYSMQLYNRDFRKNLRRTKLYIMCRNVILILLVIYNWYRFVKEMKKIWMENLAQVSR